MQSPGTMWSSSLGFGDKWQRESEGASRRKSAQDCITLIKAWAGNGIFPSSLSLMIPG